MALGPGSRLGAYEITALLGEGGMGQVYRATDTRLKRQVAIKILPPALAADTDRLARFQREAEVLAALNHPNIAHIHGLEESGGSIALVMELVEGEDLSQRIARGAIPIDEALPIAKQIAEALEAAHEQGIIHRDLKPANIKVRPDGTVKVLDFGLAKALDPAASAAAGAAMTNSPTITSPALMTGVGVLLGTAAYMAPEQARGRAVDRRAEIWAFGVVLFEMLTGTRPFTGDDVAEVLSRVLQREPDLGALPSGTPTRIHTLIARCLTKDPRQRLRDIGDGRLALEGAFDATVAPVALATASLAAGRRSGFQASLILAAVAIAALAVPALRHLREAPPPMPAETRTEVGAPANTAPLSFAISPDGRQMVFAAYDDRGTRLWLRALSATTAEPIVGTEGASLPFWSRDSRSVGFFAGGALKRVDLGGGPPRILSKAAYNARGGAWSANGVILFSAGTSNSISRVSATGDAATSATTLAPQQQYHAFPHFLPDGRRFVFTAVAPVDTAGIYLDTLDGGAPVRLAPDPSPAAYLPSGWLVWSRAGTLVAQRLDLANSALTGEPVMLAERVGVLPASVSETGLIAYQTAVATETQLMWLDRSGVARGSIGQVHNDGGSIGGTHDDDLRLPRVAPDGRRVIVSRTVQGNQDLWHLDGIRASRVTFDAAQDSYPVWSPDGTRVVFRSQRTGGGDLYETTVASGGADTRLVTSGERKTPTDWSRDGRFILFHSRDPQRSTDLWVLPVTKERVPYVLLRSPFRKANAVFSPDGRWVAYHSDESGRPEIYVRSFVAPDSVDVAAGQWQVSTAGGIHPAWRADGRELYYVDPAGAMMAAPITIAGTEVQAGAPVRLFSTRILGGGVDEQQGRQYDVAPDGRFLINTVLDSAAAPITLIQNWSPDAKK